jgi:hypothetical protein
MTYGKPTDSTKVIGEKLNPFLRSKKIIDALSWTLLDRAIDKKKETKHIQVGGK